MTRSPFKTRFRRENEQFCRLARSENAGIFGEYVEFERRCQTAKEPFVAEIGVLKLASTDHSYGVWPHQALIRRIDPHAAGSAAPA